ncbi:MAG TPA: NADH-quinone oxidoreductase subunit NuoG [Syntrophobacteria bacterium]|nr:NADH-quinone oxidoreductase subunit NuoG [Syntrophobacteria bacterium]
MPKIVIDDQEIEVPHGTKVIEAAEQLRIMIPRFCYHPALGSVGACRVCAVKFLQGPFKGVQMSCMIEARDGMVVSTTDEEAVDFRRHVIEWLMLHHPHDCPVCDEGGHCLLQDETVSGGHGIRRYLGKKRTYTDQYLGPLVQHEMNRCIHCYRCSRFYQEFTGYRDLGALGIGNRTYFGRHRDGVLESSFSGNLIDICPTGVYTDKPARFKGRRWDFERMPSLCIHCSLGCHTTASARYRELMRLEARFSEPVNGYFICDRGRFGFPYVNFPDRPRRAVVAGSEVSWADAVRAAAEQLGRFSPDAVAGVGSARSSLETLALLRALAAMQGWRGPVCCTDEAESRKVREALSGLAPELAVSLREIEQADFILALGVDPLNEAPMLALAMRQASRQGARIAVLDPRPVELPFPFDHLPLHPDEIEGYAASLVNQTMDESAPGERPLGDLAERLRRSLAPVVLCGTDVVRVTIPAYAADCARMLRAAKERAGLFFVLPGANACGAALVCPDSAALEAIVDAIETGSVRALVVAESDLFSRFPDERRLEAALDKLDLLFVVDYVATRTAARASILLPAETLYEAGGCFVNQEGRLQRALPAYRGGTPILETGGGDHPPRIFRSDISGGEPRPAWEILAELAGALSGRDVSWRGLWQQVARDVPALSPVPPLDEIPEGGIRLTVATSPQSARSTAAPPHAEPSARIDETLELILVEWTFGTEELSSLSPHLEKVEKSPCLLMHADDAARLGFENGDRVLLTLEGGTLEVDLCVKDNMAKGVLILPRHRRLGWRKMKRSPALVAGSQITKI